MIYYKCIKLLLHLTGFTQKLMVSAPSLTMIFLLHLTQWCKKPQDANWVPDFQKLFQKSPSVSPPSSGICSIYSVCRLTNQIDPTSSLFLYCFMAVL
uniref:Uncharacterized protein n=1 Tax=Neolamprologus brichardi TaxID=32507 RepID=A0A3Q4GTG0_NEOBR